MKLTVQQVHVRSTDRLDTLIEDRILALEPKLRIEEARVRLECRWEESPGFRVAVHIVTPGPDLVIESCEHTLEAAIEKAMHRLEFKIRARAGNRLKQARGRADSARSLRLGPAGGSRGGGASR